MSTILFGALPNIVERLTMRMTMPPMSVAAQLESTTVLVVVAGLVLLLLIVLVLFWRMSRKPQAAPPAPIEKTGEPPVSIVVPPPPSAPPTGASLEFVAESEQHVSYSLEKPTVTIGRAADNDIVITTSILNADTVSQHHIRLRRDRDGYVVRDLGSKNGLAVNGQQTIENLLQDGDRLRLGEVEAIFHQPAGGAA